MEADNLTPQSGLHRRPPIGKVLYRGEWWDKDDPEIAPILHVTPLKTGREEAVLMVGIKKRIRKSEVRR